MRKLFLLSGLIVVIDQITKLAVKGFNAFGWQHQGMEPGERMPFIGDLLRLNFVENPGMAFGLDFGLPILLALFSVGAAIFLVHLIRRDSEQELITFHLSLAVILGGAIGNLIDRVFYAALYGYGSLFEGKVVDFLDLDLPDFSVLGLEITRFGYIFNVADSAVTVGIILLLLSYPRYQKMNDQRRADALLAVDGSFDDGNRIEVTGLIPEVESTVAKQNLLDSSDSNMDSDATHETGDTE